MAADLSDLSVDEVSLVRKPAIRRIFALLKADTSGDLELTRSVVEAMSTPSSGEAEVVEKMGERASDAAVEAAVVARRLDAFVEKLGGGPNPPPIGSETLRGSASASEEDQDGDEDDGHPVAGEPVDDEDDEDDVSELGEDDDEAVRSGRMAAGTTPNADLIAKDYKADSTVAAMVEQVEKSLHMGARPVEKASPAGLAAEMIARVEKELR